MHRYPNDTKWNDISVNNQADAVICDIMEFDATLLQTSTV